MLQTAMALSLVVALDAPNTSTPPPMTQADPPPPSFAFDCQRESDCPVPGQCRSGRCVVSEAYVAGLERGGHARTITGGIVLGGGVVFGVLSASLIGTGYINGYDRSAIEAGYSLSGFAIGALVTGSIVLTVGQIRLRRARMLRASSWTTRALRLPIGFRF